VESDAFHCYGEITPGTSVSAIRELRLNPLSVAPQTEDHWIIFPSWMSPARRYKHKDEGANQSAVADVELYLRDSKKCFGIIRAALSLLKSVYGRPHNPKVGGSNPPPATI